MFLKYYYFSKNYTNGNSDRMTNYSKMVGGGGGGKKEPSTERPCDVKSLKIANQKRLIFYINQSEKLPASYFRAKDQSRIPITGSVFWIANERKERIADDNKRDQS